MVHLVRYWDWVGLNMILALPPSARFYMGIVKLAEMTEQMGKNVERPYQ